ncbi:MAG: ABC transporter ATP-binding protein [Anaerolineales bacterium]|nr:ABC transporter ATP-binding protein [Anaerolineales bacterium]
MTLYEFEEEEFKGRVSNQAISRILAQAFPHWPWLLGFILAIALVSILDAYFTFLGKRIIDEGIIPGDRNALTNIVILYGILLVVQAFGVFSFIYLAGVLGERIHYDLRRKLFDHLQNLSLAYFNRTPVGWIMARVTSDTERVAELVTWGLLDVTWAVLNIVTAAYFMFIINAQLALIILTIIPLLVIVAIYFRNKILLEYRNVRKINSRITAAFNENITGVKVVKALGRENANMQEFSRTTSQMYRASYRAAWLSALFLPTVQLISSFALGFIVWYGGLQAQIGIMTIGGIQAFISYITFMMWPVQDLAHVFAEMQHAMASAERIFSLLDTKPDIVDRPDSIDPGTLRSEIEFDRVDFTYEDGEPVLSDFSLKIKPGETIALVGPTGGGKTTIINLLCRFFEPKSGVIRIGGRDYTKIPLHSLQSHIGIVLQSPHLFSGTIRENIRYGRLNATDEEIEQAARLAGAHEFIKNMDLGYDEEVGEGGNLLSVGQKQLVSLTRAILSEPDIFIMDEATSSVDTLTESLIQKGMHTLMEGRTSIIIAHRLSTIKRSDRILLIKNGNIVEMGTHTELLKARGQYYHLYTHQFRRELEAEYDPFSYPNTQTN